MLVRVIFLRVDVLPRGVVGMRDEVGWGGVHTEQTDGHTFFGLYYILLCRDGRDYGLSILFYFFRLSSVSSARLRYIVIPPTSTSTSQPPRQRPPEGQRSVSAHVLTLFGISLEMTSFRDGTVLYE